MCGSRSLPAFSFNSNSVHPRPTKNCFSARICRLYRNEYGICQSCGKEIGKARLDAIPQASLCVACQEKQEKETNTARG